MTAGQGDAGRGMFFSFYLLCMNFLVAEKEILNVKNINVKKVLRLSSDLLCYALLRLSVQSRARNYQTS